MSIGNNIQQVANCIRKYKSGFKQQLDHDIISKFNASFDGMGRTLFLATFGSLKIYEGGNETGLDVDHVHMQRICNYIAI